MDARFGQCAKETSMLNLRTLLFAGSLCAAVAGTASADVTSNHVALGQLVMNSARTATVTQAPTTINPLTYISLHGGAMLTPRTGAMVGADATIPGLGLGNGWHGRLDADVIFKANLGGVDTIIPVTFDQLYYSPNAAAGHNVYYGAGLGAVLSGPARFDGKLVLGTEITDRLGAELNVHITDNDTLLTAFVRVHM